jgi:hypothetical protein
MGLGILMNQHPALVAILKEKLEYFVRKAEKKYNAPAGSYWYRFIRPDDAGVGGTQYTYTSTYTNGTAVDWIPAGNMTIPTGNSLVCFGWYLDFDPGQGGYLLIQKQNVTKSELIGRFVYEQTEPDHLYIDLDHVIYAEEQEVIRFRVMNNFGANQIGIAWPFAFRIASKTALNFD